MKNPTGNAPQEHDDQEEYARACKSKRKTIRRVQKRKVKP